MVTPWEKVVEGIDFGEGPRWHNGRLWFSDFHQRTVSAVGADGVRTIVHSGLDDRPSGLGWMPDGSLLVVAMTSQRVLREVDGALVEHADLSPLARGHCNDMLVDGAGHAYVGCGRAARSPITCPRPSRATPACWADPRGPRCSPCAPTPRSRPLPRVQPQERSTRPRWPCPMPAGHDAADAGDPWRGKKPDDRLPSMTNPRPPVRAR